MNTRPVGQLSTIISRVLPKALQTRHEIRVMQSWWSSPRSEQAARAVETRLFFDQPLLDAALQAQRQQRPRWPARLLAGFMLGAIALSSPVEQARAAEAEPQELASDAGEEQSLLDVLIDLFLLGDDDGGGIDPETGEPL